MNTPLDLDRRDGLAVAITLAPFILLSWEFFWFTLDDAYITLRYAKHLAEGSGLVWNVGADPVEGYTSSLWVVIGVIPHALGLPAVTTMKLLGVASTGLSVLFLYGYGRWRGIDRSLLVAGGAQLMASPAVAVISVQGMETTTAMVLVLVATIGALELVRAYDRRWAVVMNVALVLGLLARPGLVVFAVVLEAGLAALLVARDRTAEVGRLVVWGTGLVFVPGVLYMGGAAVVLRLSVSEPVLREVEQRADLGSGHANHR